VNYGKGYTPKLCHYCGQELPSMRMGVKFTPLKARLFDLVQRGGLNGIDRHDLLEMLQITNKALNSHIHQINSLIEDEGYRIRGRSVARLEKMK
jgi:hypothetical protein